jgi:glycosyltransferase involved in cell wall biosynthesis
VIERISKKYKIGVFVSNPPDIYSGGRYHALMLAHASVLAGNDTFYFTNQMPIFWQDFEGFETSKKLTTILYTDESALSSVTKLDFLVIVPGNPNPNFYRQALKTAKDTSAKIVLLNFESENWFYKYAPQKKSKDHWFQWRKISNCSTIVLCSANESRHYAELYYTDVPKSSSFEVCEPAINTLVADKVKTTKKEKRAILLTRFSGDTHKGGEAVADILDNTLSGYIVSIVVGTGKVPTDVKRKIESQAQKHLIVIDWQFKLSEEEKFALYWKSELLLFPSTFEGYGYPPIEARYCDCKVVAFDLPVLVETCGNDAFFAKHNDIKDFKRAIKEAINATESLNRFRIDELAPLQKMSEKLQTIFNTNANQKFQKEKISKAIKSFNGQKTSFSNRAIKILGEISHALRRKIFKTSKSITYFPKFETQEQLDNHFFRAKWYLPRSSGKLNTINFYTSANLNRSKQVPNGFAEVDTSDEHITLNTSRISYLINIIKADVLLVHNHKISKNWRAFFEFAGIPVVNIDTQDVNGKEYGDYPGIYWRYLLSKTEKRLFIDEQHEKFCDYASRKELHIKKHAVVFGTGPSIDSAFEYDFSDSLTVVCNSIVQNKELLEHINPAFVTAGDAVSHFGVSSYAAKFRNDMIDKLSSMDLMYFGTATFGYLLTLHYPHLKSKIVLIEQHTDGPAYDFVSDFSAPKLDSTMNIHMLPIASTFCDDIFILGCDGKMPSKDNEDFWAHSKQTQYHNLVDSGHMCHPVFDIHRQANTYDRHLDSVKSTLENGEKEYGKRYTSLKKSYIPSFSKRDLDEEWYKQHLDDSPASEQIKVSDIANKLGSISTACKYTEGELKLSIAHAQIKNGDLSIKGWFVSPVKNARIVFKYNDGREYFLSRKTNRPDIAKKFNLDKSYRLGIEFFRQLEGDARPTHIMLMHGNEVVLTKKIELKGSGT